MIVDILALGTMIVNDNTLLIGVWLFSNYWVFYNLSTKPNYYEVNKLDSYIWWKTKNNWKSIKKINWIGTYFDTSAYCLLK